MSEDLKIKINYAGVGELLRSQAVADYLIGVGSSVAAAAGDGYDVMQGYDRVSVFVRTGTEQSKLDNLENNTLLKATGGGQGE